MEAYLNDTALKEAVLKELQFHYHADNFVKGTYWENGKGCAVGCLLKSGNHIEYEDRYGIPVHLARLEDTLFEGLPNEKAKEWPMRFMSSFKVSKDYSNVIWEFLDWLLIDFLLPKITQEGEIFDDVRSALKDGAYALKNKDGAAAYAAVDIAAARAVDYSYDSAYSDIAAARAARAAVVFTYAADAAASADAADYAADAAVYAARAARADYVYADAAADADRAAAYEKFADKLIELIKKV